MSENPTTFHFIVSTPFGEAAIIFRQKPFLIIEILLPRSSQKKLKAAFKCGNRGKPGSHHKAIKLAKSIEGYFKGTIDPTSWPPWEWMDLNGLTVLQQSVLLATAAIPFGKVSTYKKIAEAIDRPRACRFVGTTLAKNPYPILIPCHRVIRSDSSVGQFGGGPDLKRKLIAREAKFAAVNSSETLEI
ncbi:methylated-DNA--[protein]-cysteine S-methyltransferase [Thermodesulfobacteriota bacterium]